MLFSSRKEKIFILLGGFFITNAILGEVIGGKLLSIGPFVMSMGIVPWPIVFITTDLINEYFGREGVKRLTWLTTGLIVYLFIMLFVSMSMKAASFSPVSDAQFSAVFGQSMWIIVGSIAAFVASQFLDVSIFWLLREKTGPKMIWLRATGSTLFSQLIDTFVVVGIGFYLPGQMGLAKELAFSDYINISLTGYTFKVMVAVGLTPLIYLGHSLIDKYLGKDAEKVIEKAAEESIHH